MGITAGLTPVAGTAGPGRRGPGAGGCGACGERGPGPAAGANRHCADDRQPGVPGTFLSAS